MIDWNKIKGDTEAKQKKFGRFSLADIACFALIEAIDSMFSANARADNLLESNREQAEAIDTLRAQRNEWMELYILRGKAIDDLIAERDEARRELQHIRAMLDDGGGNEDDTAIDMVKRLHEEHYALKRELSEAFNSGDGVYRP